MQSSRRTSGLSAGSPLLLVALLAACASSGQGVDAAPTIQPGLDRQATTVSGGGSGSVDQVNLFRDRTAREITIAVPHEDAYLALPAAYQALGIEVQTRSDASRALGNERLILRRRLGKTPLSSYIRCGSSGMTGDNADSYEVTMLVTTQALPGEVGRTRLATRVEATARPMGVSGSPVDCASTGKLERAIADGVLARTAG